MVGDLGGWLGSAKASVAGFEDRADVARVTADVAALAGAPRGCHHPAEMAAALDYVEAGLQQAGWRVVRAPFERRWVVGVTDAGGRHVLPRRVFRRASGINLLADPGAGRDGAPGRDGGPGGRGGVLIVAHLDSVACSPGADDNASGVAALLECARLLAGLPQVPAVRLAVVDLEERACVGSRVLAGQRDLTESLDLVVALEAVGTFLDTPGTQQLGGLGLIFPRLARQVRARESRGDFVLAVHSGRSAASAGAARRPVLPGGELAEKGRPAPVPVAEVVQVLGPSRRRRPEREWRSISWR